MPTAFRPTYFKDPNGIVLEFAAWMVAFAASNVAHIPKSAAELTRVPEPVTIESTGRHEFERRCPLIWWQEWVAALALTKATLRQPAQGDGHGLSQMRGLVEIIERGPLYGDHFFVSTSDCGKVGGPMAGATG